MSFKKFSRDRKKESAQASLEYFILFGVIALLTIISFNTFLPRIVKAVQGTSGSQGVFQRAIGTGGLNVDNR